MMKYNEYSCVILFLVFLLSWNISYSKTLSDPNLKRKIQHSMGIQPVRFVENKGQIVDMNGNPLPYVLYKAHAPGIDMYITEKGLTYVFLKVIKEVEEGENETFGEEGENKRVEWNRIDLNLKNASISKKNVTAEGISDDFSQYFLGHCPDGIKDVHSYEKITIKEIYPSIDWVFYNSNEKGFKYDFIVHSGADPDQIKLVYSSKEELQLTASGAIDIKTTGGSLTERAPESFLKNVSSGSPREFATKPIVSKFRHISTIRNYKGGFDVTIGFDFERLNQNFETLVIDPQLVWATFFGGGSVWNGITSLDCDKNGNVFATGYAKSSMLPLANPAGGAYYQGVMAGAQNVIVLKFNNAGVLLWATYYGAGLEMGNSICVDPFGNIFVTGLASSALFPVFNPGGGAYFQVSTFNRYAFILKFSNAGVRLWATVYGGTNQWNSGNSICTDLAGNIFVTGWTLATNFPVFNPGGGAYFDAAKGATGEDVFILKFSNTGVLMWATYYGGDWGDIGNSICTDPNGNVFVTGSTLYGGGAVFPVLNPGGGAYFQPLNGSGGQNDGFILKFSNSGVRIWATHFGGAGNADVGYTICSDQNGNIFVTGTAWNNTPLLNPGGGAYFQAGSGGIYIAKFSNVGVLLWATRFGGSSGEIINLDYDHITIDPCNNVYVSFLTKSTDIAVKSSCSAGYNDNSYNGPSGTPYSGGDAVITKFTNNGVLLWATYFGGSGNDHRDALAIDKYGNLFLGGEWTEYNSSTVNNATYPVTNPGGGAYYDATFNGGGTDYEGAFMSKFIPPAIVLSPMSTPAGCGCTGTASVTAAGGCVNSYNYTWYNSSWVKIGYTSTINNLCVGNYRVIVKDSVNCSIDTATIFVSGSGGTLTLTSAQNDNTCSATCNGSVSITASGGNAPYTYSWSNGLTSQIATGLCASTYVITVTDANACIANTTVILIDPLPLVAQFAKGTAACTNCGCKEWILVNAVNGTPPYAYQWPDGHDKRYKNKLCPGSYTIKVTDKNGCSVNVSITAP